MLERYSGENPFNEVNALTGARITGALILTEVYRETGEVKYFALAGACYALDAIDGWLARKRNKVTQFGGDLDKFGDRLTGIAMMNAAIKHNAVDATVLACVGAVDGSNSIATGVGLRRHTAPKELPNISRIASMGSHMGFGLNVIGNHLRRSDDYRKVVGGNVLRWSGATLAVGSSTTFGTLSTLHLWREVLRPKTTSGAFENPPVTFPHPLRSPRKIFNK